MPLTVAVGPAKIPMAKDRRVQNVDRFVVETFKDRARKILVGINDHDEFRPGLPGLTGGPRIIRPGILLSMMNCVPRNDVTDRISICHQSALSVSPLSHFGL